MAFDLNMISSKLKNLSCFAKKNSLNREYSAHVLLFAQHEPYVTKETLQELLPRLNWSQIQNILIPLEKESLFWKKEITLLIPQYHTWVWGITPRGFLFLGGDGTEKRKKPPLSFITHHYQHTTLLQKIKIKAQKQGWVFKKTQQEEALFIDALALSPQGHICGIECERTIKTKERYRLILSERLQAMKKKKYSFLIWISETPAFHKKLQTILNRIDWVPVSGIPVALDPQKHYNRIICMSYSDWPCLRETRTDLKSP